jgi:hypothetical protein
MMMTPDNYWTFEEFKRWLEYHGVFTHRIRAIGISPESVHADHNNVHFWVDKYKTNSVGKKFFSSFEGHSEVAHEIVNIRMKCVPGCPLIDSTGSVSFDDLVSWFKTYYEFKVNDIGNVKFFSVGNRISPVFMQLKKYVRNENDGLFWLRGTEPDGAAHETRLIPIVRTS